MTLESFWTVLYENADLSEYESKVYVSLILYGPNNARRLSMVCGVPRTKIYKVLKKLVERGLVVEAPTVPRTFYPTSPLNALRNVMKSYEEKTRDLNEVLKYLDKLYHNNSKLSDLTRRDLWILRGRRVILKTVREMLSRAKKEVVMITTENGSILFYKVFNREIDKLVAEKVKIRIKAPVGEKNSGIIRELEYLCEVTPMKDAPPILFLTVDGKETLLAYRNPDDYSIDSEDDLGIFFKSKVTSQLLSTLLFPFLDVLQLNHPS